MLVTTSKMTLGSTTAPDLEQSVAGVQLAAPLSLRRNFSWTLAGSVIYFGCQWAITVVLAKLGSAEMVGQFAFALAIVMPVIALTGLQLRVVQATDAKHEFDFGYYLGLRLLTVA